jgi:hypothetical protein
MTDVLLQRIHILNHAKAINDIETTVAVLRGLISKDKYNHIYAFAHALQFL